MKKLRITYLGTIHLRRRQIFPIFDPYPPYHWHSSKMLTKGIFDPYVLWPFDHRPIGTPLPPKTCVLNGWSLIFRVSLCKHRRIFKEFDDSPLLLVEEQIIISFICMFKNTCECNFNLNKNNGWGLLISSVPTDRRSFRTSPKKIQEDQSV